VAQTGAVIGREFSHALLAAVSHKEEPELQSALVRLIEAGLLFRQGIPPHATYLFKHALVQDAAYENVLKSRRQDLHRRVAEIFCDRFAAMAAAEPEVVAHHFTQAGLTEVAIEWWGKAGDRALRRSAFQEAISHLGKAIEMAERIEATGPRAAAGTAQKGQRVSLQTSYARAVMWSRGFGSAETKSAFSRAQALAVDSGSPDERFNIYYGLWFVSLARGELAFARETSESFRHDSERYGRKTETAVAHRFLALTCLCQGDLAEAQAQCDEALRIYNPERDREAKFQVAALEYLAHIKWQLGELRSAQEFIEQAIERAVASGHVWNQLNAYYYKGLLEMIGGMAGAALQAYDTVVKLCGAHGSDLFQPFASMGADWAHARPGETEPALTSLREMLTKHIDQGNKVFMPLYRGLVAEIEAGTKRRTGFEHDRSCAAASCADRRTLDRLASASHPRRDFVEARTSEHCGG
jgi:tetratricopeptide (TPR) repeat protein